MSMFWDTVEGFARGCLNAAGRQTAITNASTHNESENGRIEILCGQVGWVVDERIGDMIVLHFNDPLETTRKVYIAGNDETLVSFTVFSFAIMPASEVPEEIFGYLLQQNNEIVLGAWQVKIDEDEDALFRVEYRALGAGLTAEILKYICKSMIREVAAFDSKMRTAGLLR